MMQRNKKEDENDLGDFILLDSLENSQDQRACYNLQIQPEVNVHLCNH
jgi:hypothetical protein